MKKGWKVKKLCELGAAIREQAKIVTHQEYELWSVPSFEAGIPEPSYGKNIGSAKLRVRPDDVLICKINPRINRVWLVAKPVNGREQIGSTEWLVFRANADSGLFPSWLIHFVSAPKFREWIASEVSGATGSHTRAKADGILQQEIPVPPLPEQQRIVGILDEAFEGITTAKANAEKSLHNAKELFQSVLSRAVVGEITKEWREKWRLEKTNADAETKEFLQRIKGIERKASRSEETSGHELITNVLPREWWLSSIGSLFNLIDYRGKNPPRSTGGRRLITARNIRMGYVSDEPITFISEETYKKWMVRGFPKTGDIFFVTEGHTMGFVALNTRDDDFALAQRTITLQPAIPFDTKFVFYFMLSCHFQELVRLNATGAAAVGMKGSKFRSLPLPFPPIAEQQIIVTKLDDLLAETQRLESIYQQKLAALEALKKSLLHQAFNGEL